MEYRELVERCGVLTPEEAKERLRAAGMKISADTIRMGIQQKVFPFGDVILTGKHNPVYLIYRKPMEAWIAEHLYTEAELEAMGT